MLLELLANRHWLLEESYLDRMSAIVAERLQHGGIDSLIKPQSTEFLLNRINSLLAVDEEGFDLRISDSGIPVVKHGNKNIAVIPVIGALSKYGGMCNAGMQDYQNQLNKANADPSISGTVLMMDTPGGTVDGTPEFGLAVKNSPKPVGIFGDHMVASAGLWIASQASVIVGNKNNPTSFGSIGTLMIKEDMSTMMESGRKNKAEIIRAPQSTEKALVNSVEPLTDSTRAAVMDELSKITDSFISTVKSGRGEKLNVNADGLFKGRMFDAAEAKRIGLIDSVGTLQTAINKVADLARLKSTSTPATAGSQVNTEMKFPKLSNLFSAEGWSKVAASTEDDQATMEAAEAKVVQMEADIAQVRSENEQLTAAKAEADTQVSTLTAQVSDLNTQVAAAQAEKETQAAEITTLKAQLAAAPTGKITTIISKEEQEAKVAADAGASATVKSFRSKADDQADEYVRLTEKKLPTK